MGAVIELLKKLEPYIRDAAEPHQGYGNFIGGDPRNFHPDPIDDGTTQEEMDAWTAACAAWNAGNCEPVQPAGAWLKTADGSDMHITYTRFGLGAYEWSDPQAIEARDALYAMAHQAGMKFCDCCPVQRPVAWHEAQQAAADAG